MQDRIEILACVSGASLPKDPEPTWMGYSVGKWQGDTLVVETSGFKDGWLDGFGHARSESMRITGGIAAATSGTWTWKSASTMRNTTLGLSPSKPR